MICPHVIGNWKLNGSLHKVRDFTASVVGSEFNAEVGICVPFVYLPEIAQQLANSSIGWGAQDVSEHTEGAFTGEVAASMLQDFHCQYAIVGHSERRQYHSESDAQVVAKAEQLATFDIQPICCVGETAEQREASISAEVVIKQVKSLLKATKALGTMLIAYEPIWAIGTGKTATPEQAQQMHQLIHECLTDYSQELANTPILYGGSVNQGNALSLSKMPNINGFLVGGASLQPGSFSNICEVF